MLRLLLLILTLTVKLATPDITEGSGGLVTDDTESGDDTEMELDAVTKPPNLGSVKDVSNDGTTTSIIIAAVSLVALAVVAVIAVVLFRRYLHNQEQGVYTVPVEQGQKGV
ncbi:uncharacterized protein si:dkey-262k9.2 [Trichomycterus rosablanca]|uniref:uncharacterized protein si:dkey-262k9.2 n=1 Tax=Trichomycterus rosablanca TaxID=2290929 RepID=UPI002F35EEA2